MPFVNQNWVVWPLATTWSTGLVFDQIDPALGILTISLTLTGFLHSTVTVANYDLAPASFSSTDQGSIVLDHSDGSIWLTTAPSTTVSAALDPGAQVSLDGYDTDTATANYGPQTASWSEAGSLIGTGGAVLQLNATARISATGPGNMRATFTSLAGAQATVQAQTEFAPGWSGTFGNYVYASMINAPLSTPGLVTSAPQVLIVGEATTGATSALTLAGFDPSLGWLAAVTVKVSSHASGSARFENLDPVAGRASIDQSATLRVDGPDGTALQSSTTDLYGGELALAGFDGRDDLTGASAGTVNMAGSNDLTETSQGQATLTGAALDGFLNAGPVTLDAVRTGTTTISGPGNLDVATTLQAGGTVTVAYEYYSADISYTDKASGATGTGPAEAYTGPVGGLQHQYLWSGADGVTLTGCAPNIFLKGGSGDDTLAVTSGNNVLDGGAGSNVLVGGTGDDTFFVDARAGAVTWSTIVGFHAGDQAAIFGFQAGTSTQPLTASDGPSPHKGVTIHSEIGGLGTGVDASLTFDGINEPTAAEHFVYATGTLPGDAGYLLIQYQ